MSHPTVDISFIDAQIKAKQELELNGYFKVGRSHAYIITGHKPLHKRRIVVREFEDNKYNEPQVNFMQATGTAIVWGFMRELLDWYEENRDWKEGGHFVPH